MSTSQGRRLRGLSDAFHKTVKFTLRPAGPEEFAAHFGDLRPEFVEVAYDAYQQALHRVRVLAETDFQSICEENALRDKLYALEQLCEQQGIADSDEAAAAGGSNLQRPPAPSRAGPLAEAQQLELERLREELAQAKQGLTQLEGQLADRRQQLHTVLNKARPIALANQQVHEASKAWGSRTVDVAS